MKYRQTFVLTLLIGFSVSNAAQANLSSRTTELCEKVQTCAIGEFERQGMSPQTIARMQPILEGMCEPVLERYSREIAGKPGLEKKAEACLDTFMDTSCDVLMRSQGDFDSPECKEFKRASAAAGIDAEKIGQDAAKDLLIAPIPQESE